jgi:nucleoside-diphosphate kinase
MSGPVIALALEAPNAVEAVRQMIGATDPMRADRGTIRGDLATSVNRNLVHASDSPEAAATEIARFFPAIALRNMK